MISASLIPVFTLIDIRMSYLYLYIHLYLGYVQRIKAIRNHN